MSIYFILCKEYEFMLDSSLINYLNVFIYIGDQYKDFVMSFEGLLKYSKFVIYHFTLGLDRSNSGCQVSWQTLTCWTIILLATSIFSIIDINQNSICLFIGITWTLICWPHLRNYQPLEVTLFDLFECFPVCMQMHQIHAQSVLLEIRRGHQIPCN